ncbi:MAG TPA: hypothetical protein PLF42_07715, partial [Anaerolineales bacterium]|nr:hypothetical protein [Anaerolineales bacterium]
KAKRVDVKDFPVQGRYGKGVVAWDLPSKVTLAAIASGKPNYVATIHLSKGAPKSTRLDAAGSRKRASTKGDLIVEVKPGEEVLSVNVGWTVERFVAAEKKVESKKKEGKRKEAKPKKATPGKTKSPKGKKAAKPVAKKTSKAVKKKPVAKKKKK